MTEDQKIKIGDANRGKKRTSEHIEKIAKSIRGTKQSEETKRKRAESNRGQKRSEESKKRIAHGVTNAMKNPELRKRLSAAAKASWANPEVASRQIAAVFAAMKLKPNKSERLLDSILNDLYPGEYAFVGDGSLFVDGLNPDFVNVNGQKKIIELFGERFHRPNGANKEVPFRRTEAGRKMAFGKYGYQTLIIWWKELRNKEKLTKTIREFHRA